MGKLRFGYAQVSTDDQTTALQADALKLAECSRVYADKASGKANVARPQPEECLADLREGDSLVGWQLDRLGRSLPDLVRIVTELEQKGVAFESFTERLETSSASGKLIFHVFAALAEFERNLIRERTKAVRTQDREVEMHFIPVRQRLLDHVNRFGNALHYSSGGHADDAWWGDLELSARDALQELRVCAKATLLGVPLMRTDSTEVLTKFEFPTGDARAAYLMDLAHSGSEHQFLVEYIPTEFFYMTERGDAAPADVARQQQP